MKADGALDEKLRCAVAQNSILPAFQPIVHLTSKRISSFEVLARWTDPELGPVAPVQFISALERLLLIADMTDQLIQTACHAARAWAGSFRLTFNVSPAHFHDGHMPALLMNAVEKTGFPLDRTQVEITENALLENGDAAREIMHHIRSKGVHILLDDFGTGHSNLARLLLFPFDKIKIDASFISALEMSRDSRKIVSAVIGLGQSLGVPVIAEGVETIGQERILLDLGCDLGQGWLYGYPVPPKDVPEMLLRAGQEEWDKKPSDLSTNHRLAHLDAVYNMAPIGLCSTDRKLHILKLNDAWISMLGESFVNGLGQYLQEVDPRIAEMAWQAMRATPCGPNRASQSIALREGQGDLFIFPTIDEQKEVIGLSFMLMPKMGSKTNEEHSNAFPERASSLANIDTSKSEQT